MFNAPRFKFKYTAPTHAAVANKCWCFTSGDEDVGEDDEGGQGETGQLRDPPPQVRKNDQNY